MIFCSSDTVPATLGTPNRDVDGEGIPFDVNKVTMINFTTHSHYLSLTVTFQDKAEWLNNVIKEYLWPVVKNKLVKEYVEPAFKTAGEGAEMACGIRYYNYSNKNY